MLFAQPDNLWSLLLLVPMIGALVGYWVWRQRLMERVGDHALLAAMASASSPRRKVARAVFAVLGTLLLCVAVAQPQWGQTDRPIRRTGVDVVFALDLSESMLARDVKPSRLQGAKDEVETTLDMLSGDRVGLVVFTAISFVQTPLTIDYGAIRFYLAKLRTGQMPRGGTSLGRALTDAVELLTGERVQEATRSDMEMHRSKSQVIVLITDGEDHESDPLAAAKLAAERGIKIVTVGLGSPDGEKIPVLRPDGSLAGYKRNKSGEVVKTSLDESTLKQMAEITGGIYIPYTGPNSVASGLVEYVNELEKSEIETLMKERYRERFGFFLAPGLVLLVLSLMLGDRRRRPSRVASIAGIGLVLALLAGCERPLEDTLGAVDDGNELLAAGDFEGALAAYREAEKQIPARPELHYDIGRALLGLEKWDEAADAFARALETTDPALEFQALYNLGIAHSGAERWLEAWESFRDAIAVADRLGWKFDDPRLVDARHNLEVAWRKFYPPCSELEDELEENDAPSQATKLQQPKVEKAALCGGDDDWYVIDAIPGTRVEVKARFRDLREEPDPERAFLPQNPDLQLAVFDSAGERAIVVDQGLDAPPVADRKTSRTIARFAVDETMVSQSEPRVLLKVGAAENLEFEYDLEIFSIPPCRSLEEDSEDNDFPEQAKRLQAGNHQMHTCPADDDWFVVDLVEGDTLFVDVMPRPDVEKEVPPSLQVEVFDPNQVVVATGEVEGGYVTAGIRDVKRPGTYTIHVFGTDAEQQGPYALDLYRYGAECIANDDRLEENDTANAAAPLDPQIPVQRYLRACSADPDFFRIDFPEDAKEKSVSLGLANVSTPAPDTDPLDRPVFAFDMVSPSGDQILVAGQAVEVPGDVEEPPVPVSHILEAPEVEGESAIIRVAGQDEYYHLVQLDEPPPSDQQNDQNQEQQQDGESGDQQQEDQQESGDQSDDQSESDDQGDEQDSPSDDGEQTPEGDEEEQADASEAGEEESDDEAPKPSEQADAEMGRIEELLNALEQTDDNFQMRKALENMPPQFIEKDW